MKMMAMLQDFIARIRSHLKEWAAANNQACRVCGIAFFLFAAILALPSLLSLVFHFGQYRSGLRGGTVDILASYILSSLGLALGASVTSAIAGAILFTEAARIGDRKLSKPENLRRYGYLMLGLSSLVLFPLLSSIINLITGQLFPFRVPFAVIDFFRSFSALFYRVCFLGLPLVRHHEAMSWLIFITYIIALNVFGLAIFSFAINLLKRSKQWSPGDAEGKFTLAARLQSKNHIARARIYRWIDTDSKACRASGVVCFLFAAILVLPVIWFQISTVFFQGKMTAVVDIWMTGGSQSKSSVVIPTLLMLAITLGAVTFALFLGAKMFAKARKSQEPDRMQCKRQCKRVLQRFAWLLLAILPMVTVFNFRWGNSYTIAGQLNLSMLFSIVNSSWKEARATFLWMQFYPLLLLGIVALALAVSMRPQCRKTEGSPGLEENK